MRVQCTVTEQYLLQETLGVAETADDFANLNVWTAIERGGRRVRAGDSMLGVGAAAGGRRQAHERPLQRLVFEPE